MSAVRHYGFAHFHQDTQLPLSKGATNNRVFLHQMEVTVYIAPLERKLDILVEVGKPIMWACVPH